MQATIFDIPEENSQFKIGDSVVIKSPIEVEESGITLDIEDRAYLEKFSQKEVIIEQILTNGAVTNVIVIFNNGSKGIFYTHDLKKMKLIEDHNLISN